MPVCDEIDWKIEEGVHPHLICTLDPGETVVAEAGAMVWKGPDIEMATKMGDGRNRKKGAPFSGILQAFGRKLTQQGVFMTHFHNTGPMAEDVAFTPPVVSSVVPIDMKLLNGERLICQKGAFLAAALGTKLSWEMAKKMGMGLFGGEGWFLQQIEGDGMVFLSAGGSVVERQLVHDEPFTMDHRLCGGLERGLQDDRGDDLGGLQHAVRR